MISTGVYFIARDMVRRRCHRRHRPYGGRSRAARYIAARHRQPWRPGSSGMTKMNLLMRRDERPEGSLIRLLAAGHRDRPRWCLGHKPGSAWEPVPRWAGDHRSWWLPVSMVSQRSDPRHGARGLRSSQARLHLPRASRCRGVLDASASPGNVHRG